ncbi:MAG: hypothetical protein FWF81_02110 [Defluviitaleaceae bacterium]|nr:hypothetical protein [Defluviitaleaceae bacterium]
MELAHRFIHNFMLGLLILLSYQKIIHGKKTKTLPLLGGAFIFAVYMFFAYAYIVEPIRAIIGVLILGTLLYLWQHPTNWAALVLAFLFGYFAWFVSLVISAGIVATTEVLHSELFAAFQDREIYYFLLLFSQATTYFALYKAVRLKNGIPSIAAFEIKGIIFAATGIVLSVYGMYHMTINRMYEHIRPLFFAFLIVLIIAILTGGYFMILFSKRHKEKLAADDKHQRALKKLRTLERLQHRYRDLVPAVSASHNVLLDKVKSIAGAEVEQTQEVTEYLKIVEALNVEFGEEIALDDLVREFKGIVLPVNWLPLKLQIVKMIEECEQTENLFMLARNTATTWEQINVPKVKFTRLVGNLLRNAVRELEQSKTDEKEVLVRFFDDENNFFAVEVFDTAHAFPISILTRLGERGNSTNGTGNGYVEIFEFLAESGASLIITEQAENGKDTKTIRIVFDGKERLAICTAYRYAELKTTLAGTQFEVERLA